MKSSSSIDSSLSFSLSNSIIFSTLSVDLGCYHISGLAYVTGPCDGSIEFSTSKLLWKSLTFGGWSSHLRKTPVLSKSRHLVLSNVAVDSIVFSHSDRLLPSDVISDSDYHRGSHHLSESVMIVSDANAESGRFPSSDRFDGSDVLVVTKLSMNSTNEDFSNLAAESALPEHSHQFRFSESVSVPGCISGLSFLAISIALHSSRQNDGRNSIVESVNVISPRFQFSPLDRGTLSLLLSDLLISEGHRLSKAGSESGLRPSVSVLESRRLGDSNHLSPSHFALVSGRGPVVQQSHRLRFSRSISMNPLLSPSYLLLISSILDRNSSIHYVSNSTAKSAALMESLRLGHPDLASRALVTSTSGGAAATVSFGASGWNSVSDWFTASSALIAFAGPQGSRLASLLGLILSILAAVLLLLLLLGCIIWLVRKRRRTTVESDLDYPIEIDDEAGVFVMEDSDSENGKLGFYENPESSSVKQFDDFADEENVIAE
jgi:hypothetical protein